ncbi:protein PFC0760c-like isoform X2 [Melanaphis sacchari]|uniref:protein PFC0760c-like isoform X2 n=1 Tax=Melanaphis sacchari TaxID=742174 RepID=UPI000DC13DDD|nr:protein PFC0760c-like isoform X2 [Melanaphis sacchari]
MSSSSNQQPVVEDIISVFETTQNQSWSIFNDKLNSVSNKDSEKKDPVKSENSVTLSSDDVPVFGLVPRLDKVMLVSCNECEMIVKRDCIHSHFDRRHNSNDDSQSEADKFSLANFLCPVKTNKNKKLKMTVRKPPEKKINEREKVITVKKEIKTEFDQAEYERLLKTNRANIKQENTTEYVDQPNVDVVTTSCNPSTSSSNFDWDVKPCIKSLTPCTDHKVNDKMLEHDKDLSKLSTESPSNKEDLQSNKYLDIQKIEHVVNYVTSSTNELLKLDPIQKKRPKITIDFSDFMYDYDEKYHIKYHNHRNIYQKLPHKIKNIKEETKVMIKKEYPDIMDYKNYNDISTFYDQPSNITAADVKIEDYKLFSGLQNDCEQTKYFPCHKYLDIKSEMPDDSCVTSYYQSTEPLKEEFKFIPNNIYPDVKIKEEYDENNDEFNADELTNYLSDNNHFEVISNTYSGNFDSNLSTIFPYGAVSVKEEVTYTESSENIFNNGSYDGTIISNNQSSIALLDINEVKPLLITTNTNEESKYSLSTDFINEKSKHSLITDYITDNSYPEYCQLYTNSIPQLSPSYKYLDDDTFNDELNLQDEENFNDHLNLQIEENLNNKPIFQIKDHLNDELNLHSKDNLSDKLNLQIKEEFDSELHLQDEENLNIELNLQIKEEFDSELHLQDEEDLNNELNLQIKEEFDSELHLHSKDNLSDKLNLQIKEEFDSELYLQDEEDLNNELNLQDDKDLINEIDLKDEDDLSDEINWQSEDDLDNELSFQDKEDFNAEFNLQDEEESSMELDYQDEDNLRDELNYQKGDNFDVEHSLLSEDNTSDIDNLSNVEGMSDEDDSNDGEILGGKENSDSGDVKMNDNLKYDCLIPNNEDETKCLLSKECSVIINNKISNVAITDHDQSSTLTLDNEKESEANSMMDDAYIMIDNDGIVNNFENEYYRPSSELYDHDTQTSFTPSYKYSDVISNESSDNSDESVSIYDQSSVESLDVRDKTDHSSADNSSDFTTDESFNDSDSTSDNSNQSTALHGVIKKPKYTQTNLLEDHEQFMNRVTKLAKSLGIVDGKNNFTQTDVPLECMNCYKITEDFIDSYSSQIDEHSVPINSDVQINENDVNNFTPISSSAQIINNTIIPKDVEEYELKDNKDCDSNISNKSHYLSHFHPHTYNPASQNNNLMHNPINENNYKINSSEHYKPNEHILHGNTINEAIPFINKNNEIYKELMKIVDKSVPERKCKIMPYTRITKNLKKNLKRQVADDKENRNHLISRGFKKFKMEFIERDFSCSDESDNNDNVND